MNKFIFIVLSLIFNLPAMELEVAEISLEKKEAECLNNDVYLKIFEQALLNSNVLTISTRPLIPEIEKNISAVTEILKIRSNLIQTQKSFLDDKKFIDKYTIEALKKFNPKILNIFLIKLIEIKNLNNRSTLANLLVQAGANPAILFEESKIYEFVTEALKSNNTSWLEFLLNNNLDPNFTNTKEKYALSTTLKLVNKYPCAALNMVKLLLTKGANPLLTARKLKWTTYISATYKYKTDTIAAFYKPKKSLQLKKLKRDYDCIQAAQIAELLDESIKNIKLYKKVGLI